LEATSFAVELDMTFEKGVLGAPSVLEGGALWTAAGGLG
jgi:hypothetical protein